MQRLPVQKVCKLWTCCRVFSNITRLERMKIDIYTIVFGVCVCGGGGGMFFNLTFYVVCKSNLYGIKEKYNLGNLLRV